MIQEIYPLEAKDYRLAGSISSAIKKKARLAQLEDALIRRISIACYEAEINMIIQEAIKIGHEYGNKRKRIGNGNGKYQKK